MYARKQDTRRKIELGGLVIKAGLAGESAEVLLGLLVEAKSALADGALDKNKLAAVGANAFVEKKREIA